LKIAFANILYSKKQERGGLGTHIAMLSSELARRGHEVTVLTSGEGQPYVENRVRIVPLGRIDAFSRSLQVLHPAYLFRRFAYMLRMTRYVLAGDFDIVETADGGFEQLFLAGFFRRAFSLVTKLHGNFRLIYSQRGLLAYLAGKAERFAVRRSDGIYASTIQYAESISHAYGIPLVRIKIIPYAIETQSAELLNPPDPIAQYPSLRGKRIVFLSVGSSPMRKGAPLFLETAARCERDQVRFVLSCNDQPFLERARIPENVLVVGDLDQSQFYGWLRASDVVVFPSSGESFCIAVHEAMLFGKAIVVSKQIPLEGLDLEYPKCAVLENVQADVLERAIFYFLDARAESFAGENKFYERFALRYGIKTVVDQTEEFYQSMRVSLRIASVRKYEENALEKL
jgi:glycosyltransferase involved in cell wall biosynthesis